MRLLAPELYLAYFRLIATPASTASRMSSRRKSRGLKRLSARASISTTVAQGSRLTRPACSRREYGDFASRYSPILSLPPEIDLLRLPRLGVSWLPLPAYFQRDEESDGG